MSANAKKTEYAAATDEKIDAALKDAAVPTQTTGEKSDAKSAAVLTIGDALKAVEEKRSEGMTVSLSLDENGEIQVQVNEISEGGKAKKLVAGAKGVFQRNKKLVLASAGLVATSVLLKVIASRRDELEQVDYEDAEVVETSDDVSTDA